MMLTALGAPGGLLGVGGVWTVPMASARHLDRAESSCCCGNGEGTACGDLCDCCDEEAEVSGGSEVDWTTKGLLRGVGERATPSRGCPCTGCPTTGGGVGSPMWPASLNRAAGKLVWVSKNDDRDRDLYRPGLARTLAAARLHAIACGVTSARIKPDDEAMSRHTRDGRARLCVWVV